jgi:hypothetical protein
LVPAGAITPNPATHSPLTPLVVDTRSRLLYAEWQPIDGNLHLSTYDLRPPVPRLVHDWDLGHYGFIHFDQHNQVFDLPHQRLYSRNGTSVEVVDLNTGHVVATWDLQSQLPGFGPYGGAVGDGLVYFVGEMAAAVNEEASFDKPGAPLPGLAAIRISDGKLAWWRPVPQCNQILKTADYGGALLARSKFFAALYFGCGTDNRSQPEADGVRLWLPPNPASATTQAALGAKVELFPISGAYRAPGVTAAAVFDEPTDRMFFQSLSPATPGAFVFDGRLSAWVGQIQAPAVDSHHGFPYYLGIDPALDRYYMAAPPPAGCTQNCGYVVSSTKSAFPVEQGLVQTGPLVNSDIVADPETHRLFFSSGYSGLAPVAIYRDTAPREVLQKPLDYDALTTGRPESAASFVSYSGSADGYGSELTLVGGTGAIETELGVSSGLPTGTRAVMGGRISTATVSGGGAGAGAQSLVPDAVSLGQFESATNPPPGTDDYPYPAVNCLDGGGGKPVSQAQTGAGGSASVTCALAKQQSVGAAAAGEVSADTVSVGSSTASTNVARNVAGVVSTMTSAARGINVSTPVGTLTIGETSAVATATAHGSRGSASAVWTRSVQHVTVRDTSGKVVLQSPGCTTTVKAGASDGSDTCTQLADAVNSALQNWLRLSFPSPAVLATPKGAYAVAQQRDGDYAEEVTLNQQGVIYTFDSIAQRPDPALRLVVYNDSQQASRVLVQLAAVQASALYLISDTPSFPPPPSTSPAPSTPGTLGSVQHIPGVPGSGQADLGQAPAVAGANQLASSQGGEVTGILLSTRALTEGVLLAGLWSLALAAALVLNRRRRLLNAMGDLR